MQGVDKGNRQNEGLTLVPTRYQKPGKRRLNDISKSASASAHSEDSKESEKAMISTVVPCAISVSSVITIDSDSEASSRIPSGQQQRKSSSLPRRIGSFENDEVRAKRAPRKRAIGKLQFDSIGLIGRENETTVVKSCLETMLTNSDDEKRKKFIILVNGCSGVGKTVFLEAIKQEALDLAEDGRITIGEGKFDINSSNVPYSAIASAFGKICETINQQLHPDGYEDNCLSQHHHQSSEIGQKLVEEVGENIHVLAKLIPQLDLLLPSNVQSIRNARLSEFDVEAAQSKWEHAFRVMTRVINGYCGPLVIMLDDLHWADVSSLNVVDSLISDAENENKFMIVGCYRSNEENISLHLTSRIESMEAKQKRFNFQISSISLTNLNLDGVNQVAMGLLSVTDESQTRSLAEVCFKRSLGNPFYLIEFMSLLEQEGLLSFDKGSLLWKWDTSVIEERTISKSNVVDLVSARIETLPIPTQLLLQYAACLGSRIKLETLYYLWSKLDIPQGDLSSLLTQLVQAKFFERVDDRTFRWVHDQVKETALMTGDAAEPAFQFEVGCTLFHALDDNELEELLFEVTDLINSARVGRRLEFAKLNLRAAEKAKRISAFNSAATYAAKGIERLPNECWMNHKDTTLSLYTIGVLMELAVGRIEIMEKYSKEVLSQPSCTALEKAPVYLAQCYKLVSVDFTPSASIDLGLKVLRDEFKVKFGGPRLLRPATAIAALVKTIKAVKKKDKNFFAKLGEMTDPEHLVIMDVISRISYSGYFSKDVFIQVLCTIKLVELTMNHGVGALGGFPFISLSLLAMVVMKDTEAASQFTELGFMLQEKCKSGASTAAASFVANQLIYAWIRPGLSLAKPSLEIGYSAGLRAGNSEMALWCHVSNHIIIPFQVGRPLGPVLAKCSALAAQCEQLKLVVQEVFIRVHWQLILNLMGSSDADAHIGGDNEERLPFQKVDVQFKEIHELVFFGNYEDAAKVALELGDSFDKTHANAPQVMPVNFMRGIALYAMARKTRMRKYRRQAKRVRDKIGGWLKAGNPNVTHFYPLLCAEQAALDRKREEAKRLYHDATVLSARTGHIQFAALANERYADFCRHELGDENEARFRIAKAIRYYQEWGAHAKVEQLQRLHGGDRTQAILGASSSALSVLSA